MTTKIEEKEIEQDVENPQKKAPDVELTEDEMIEAVYKDDRKGIMEDALKALGEKANGMHLCYQDGSDSADNWKRKGYEQVKIANKIINHKGDPLTMCSEKEHRMYREAPAIMAKQELEDARTGAGDKYKAVDNTGNRYGLEEMGD